MVRRACAAAEVERLDADCLLARKACAAAVWAAEDAVAFAWLRCVINMLESDFIASMTDVDGSCGWYGKSTYRFRSRPAG
jgi:hypothetical protein